MIVKKNILLIFILLCFKLLFAQEKNDSTNKNIALKEVVICSENKNEQNDAFNFYRSSKIINTEEILGRIEGVNLIRRGAFGIEPMLRSYNAGQINILINGMRMYGACTDKMDPVSSYIEPINLANLQINQGAGASINGSTIGGSINFNLKEAYFNHKNKPSVVVYSQYTTVNNGFNNGINANLNNKKIAFRFSGIYRNVGNYFAGGEKEIQFTQYEKYNVQLNSIIKLSKKHLVITDIIYDKGINIGYAALPMDVSLAKANVYSLTHRFEIKKQTNSMLETKIYFNEIVHFMDDTKRPETPIHMDMPGWSNTKGFYTKLNFDIKKHSIQTRLDAHKAFTKAEMTMYPKNEKEMYMQTLPGNDLFNIGFAMQYQYKINKLYGIGASIREDYFEQKAIDEIGILQWKGFGFDVSKQSNNWLINSSIWFEKNTAKLNSKFILAYGSRLPTSNEKMGLYLFNRADGYDYLGNYNLKPEQTFQTDFINSLNFKKISITTTLFFHRISNYIYANIIPDYIAMTIGARGVKTYSNINFANLTGFEAYMLFKLNNHFYYRGNMRYTFGLLSNNLYMQQVPPFKILNTLKFKNDSIQLQLEHSFAATQNFINTDFGETKTNYWNTLNIRFSYLKVISNSIFQVNIAVENIFDSNFREHLDWGKIPQPGRNFVIGINYYLN